MHLIVYIHNNVSMSPLLEFSYEQCELQDMKPMTQLFQSKKFTDFNIIHPIMFFLLTNDTIIPSNRTLYWEVNLNIISSNTFRILKNHLVSYQIL